MRARPEFLFPSGDAHSGYRPEHRECPAAPAQDPPPTRPAGRSLRAQRSPLSRLCANLQRFRCLGAFFYLLRSEEHTSALQSLMRTSYAVLRLETENCRSEEHTLYATSLIHLPSHLLCITLIIYNM